MSASNEEVSQEISLKEAKQVVAAPKKESPTVEEVKKDGFVDFDFHEKVQQGIASQNIHQPTPVQKKAIPIILSGSDVRVSAPTGTGKTGTYSWPILDLLEKNKIHKQVIRALVIIPTRELALQVHERVRLYSKFSTIKPVVVCGGMKISSQIDKLRRKTDVLIATPGRLLDLVNQNIVCLRNIEMLVLDEADRMLDMGFMPDVERILKLTPKDCQRLLFSATYNKKMEYASNGLLKNPKVIEVSNKNHIPEKVKQTAHPVEASRKIELVINLLSENNWSQVLVFTKTKRGADNLAYQLNKSKFESRAIHGDLTQSKRNKVLTDFRNNKTQVLVATDVASRGLDIKQLDCVINYDLPSVIEDYLHRVGRTGRAGASGEAITLLTNEDRSYWQLIMKELSLQCKLVYLEGYGADFNDKVKSSSKRGGRSGRSSQDRFRSDQYRKGSEGGRSRGRISDGNRSEGYRSDSRRSDGNRSDSRRSEGYRSDSRRSEGNRSDSRRSDGNRSDSRRSDGNRSEGRRSEGRLSINKHKKPEKAFEE